MSTTNNTTSDYRAVTPEMIEAAMLRGRRERSEAFWAMLQGIFGRPEERDSSDDVMSDPDRVASVVR